MVENRIANRTGENPMRSAAFRNRHRCHGALTLTSVFKPTIYSKVPIGTVDGRPAYREKSPSERKGLPRTSATIEDGR